MKIAKRSALKGFVHPNPMMLYLRVDQLSSQISNASERQHKLFR